MNTLIFSNEIENIFPLMIPGVSAIICIVTERVYIARSFNCARQVVTNGSSPGGRRLPLTKSENEVYQRLVDKQYPH